MDLSTIPDSELLKLRQKLANAPAPSGPLSEMSDKELLGLRQQIAGGETTASGLAKSAASAVPKGIFNLVGMFGGMNDLGKAASTWIMQKTGMSQEDIAQAMVARQQFDPLARAFDAMPNPQDVQGAVEKFTGKLPLYEPKTRGEKTVDTAIQLALGMGKPTAAMLGKVVLPATAGTEIAGALTDDNHAARVAGGLMGGAGAALANAYTSIPANTIRQAVGDLTPAQLAAAELRQAQAKAAGVPLMGAESLPNSGIQQLASDVMASRTGAPVVRKFLDQRPDQVRAAVGGMLDDIAPYRSPGEAAQMAEKTAADVLSGKNSDAYIALGSNKARTLRTSPYWEQQKQADLTTIERQAKTAETKAALLAQLKEWQQTLPGRKASLNDVAQQWGQLKAREAELQNSLKTYDNPQSPSIIGDLINIRNQAREAGIAAKDVAAILPQRRAEVTELERNITGNEGKLAQIGEPKPSKLEYGLQSIIGNLDSEIGLAGAKTDKGKILSDLKAQLNGLTLPSQVDTVYQAFSKRLKPGATAPIEERIAAGILAEPVKALGVLTEQVSGPIAAGRKLYAEITESQVNPLQSSLIGKMAPKEGFYDAADPTNLTRVTNTITKGVDTSEIRQLYTHMNAQDAKAFPAVARGMLEQHFDAATKRVQPGENVKMGANFANAVRGTDQQRANLDEILRGVAEAQGKKPDDLVNGATVLMDTLAATGKIPGTGSQTATRLGTQTELSRNPVSATSDIISTRPLAMFARGADSLFNARRNRIVAEWLTAPNSVEIIAKMAKLKPNSVNARFYLEQLLNANKEATASAQ